jgi:exosortase
MRETTSLPLTGVSRARLATIVPLLGIASLTALLVWPAFAHALEVWSTTSEFSYGFFVPPIALLLIWWRREALRRSIGPGARAGLPMVVVALAIYLLAVRVGINALIGLAVIPLLWSIVVYLWGWRAVRVLAFPIGFLAFGLGLYRGLLNSVGFALQEITALGASTMGQALGLSMVRDGLVLQSERFSFIVAEPCSGMSSLLSLLALGALWTYVSQGSLPARLAVLLSVLPVVILANSVRVTLVLLVATWFGQDVAVGFFHSVSSLVVFAVALSGLLLISRMVGCKTLSIAA